MAQEVREGGGEMTKKKLTAHEALRRRIDASGMSADRFAEVVLLRNRRTVNRWLGGGKIPAEVERFLLGSHDGFCTGRCCETFAKG
jgi:hypothetical protein